MKHRIRVLFAEDHQLVREGLRSLMRDEHDIEIVGEAGDGLDAVLMAESLRPDVVLMDVGLPGLNGIEAARRIRAARPEIPVMFLSMHDDAQTVDRALRAGARGYVLKGMGVAHVCQAIRTVHRGEIYLSPQVSECVLQGYLSGSGEEEEEAPLTSREREVLQLVAEGYTAPQIARKLELSPRTVENHRARIMDKLGIGTIAGLVRYAIHNGIIQ